MHSLDAAAEWFLRLNGFFTIQNFVVHPVTSKEGTVQRTDADVLGVRFPGRREVVGGDPLVDHDAFQNAPRPLLIIAEVKAGRCRLNGPWSRREAENVTNVLRSFGKMATASFEAIAEGLYENGRYQSGELDATLICFGATRSQNLPQGILQFTWEEIFGFTFDRYESFRRAKCQNQQWPSVGRFLWDQSKDIDRAVYVSETLKAFGVSA
jgi:hypothetical protein